ncbi:AraC family transcriptional regulator [Sansalvadorimonas sp. 2012CJ34-2]|uniref:AraC family transcriptional regulator n=1 Tax=Parendozoicomonas callyspongiae TaxID=2942213 RepID=A0ABT0PLE2_9GAMM|nr:AraC family transcriptional regulator [Sansalvadorimonas sp. 2012CJ34-2]MCL6272202.1 AraC family transcriptional regulator [Sansalvadorimonas sp. 2012CJ34-2]
MQLGELSIEFIHPLIKATRDADRDPSRVLNHFNINRQKLSEPDQWISIPRFMRVGEALLDLTDNPTLGLDAARHNPLQGSGLAGFAAMTAPDLLTAFSTLIRFETLYSNNVRGNSSLTNNNSWSINFYSIAPYNEFNRFIVDFVLMKWVSLAIWLSGKQDIFLEIHFEFPAPHFIESYINAFPCPVLFGKQHNRVLLKQGSQVTPVLFHSQPDHQRFLQLCQQQVGHQHHPLSLTHKCARAIAKILPHPCTLEKVAEELRTTHWTLRRKLHDEGVSFKEILENTRRDMACSYLSSSPVPIAEVAYLTGFSSTEAFQRAFKRWTGHPPGEYRRINS